VHGHKWMLIAGILTFLSDT